MVQLPRTLNKTCKFETFVFEHEMSDRECTSYLSNICCDISFFEALYCSKLSTTNRALRNNEQTSSVIVDMSQCVAEM